MNGYSCLLIIFVSFYFVRLNCQHASAATAVDVGVILDLETTVGKICRTCISMAIEDFYSEHKNYSTMVAAHFRDSNSDDVAAAFAAMDLLKNTQVMAIIGPQKSTQADFVVDIGNKVGVPILSAASSPAISPEESSYFVRSAWCSSSQAKAIGAIVKAFGWREVVFIYEDTIYGSGLVPFVIEGLVASNAVVSYQSVVSVSARNDQILEQLHKLKSTLRTRVFIVHLTPILASRVFLMAKEAGMMGKGYAWIIADMLTSLLDSLDGDTIRAMQGVVGVKAFVPRSDEVKNFTRRWSKRFHKENPDLDRTELNVFGLWAYDSVTALAEAIEHVGVASPRFKKPVNRGNLTDLEAIGTSNTGQKFVRLIRNFMSKGGLSGDLNISNGQLQPSAFEIVNVIGKGENIVGFWTETYGISKNLKPDDDPVYSTTKENLGGILWPGQTSDVPKGWEFPTGRTTLQVGVPATGFTTFVNIERNAETNSTRITGFCVDVFKQVMGSLPYAVPYELIHLELLDDERARDYDDVFKWIASKDHKYDALVGDLTITANRSELFDFTFPHTESGVATVVPIKDKERKDVWVFMKPLTVGLWLTIGAFFVFTGFVVWVLEHRVNGAFRGSLLQQVGMIFWFSFSTLVFAHREKVMSNLTRTVVIVWVFVVLVLTSSYTASLTSMLTVQQLQPTVTDIYDLVRNGEYIGCRHGSFVSGLLKNMKFESSMIRKYSTLEEYEEALSKGSRNGGVAAIVDEIPYLRLFLSKYCHTYTMIGPTYPTSGFGFAFQKGSPLVPDVSREILKLKEGEEMARISRKWFKEEQCSGSDETMITSQRLDLDSFKGLFLIAGSSSTLSLAIFLANFLFENRCLLTSTVSVKQKLYELCRAFNEAKDDII